MMNKQKLDKEIIYQTVLFAITLFIQAFFVLFLNIPKIPDEVNPLAFGFFLKGNDWSQYLMADGYYYKYGQLLFYLPFLLMIQDKIILYRTLLLINSIIASCIPVCAFKIVSVYLKSKNNIKNFMLALLIGTIPAVVFNSKLCWAEPILMLIPWVILLLILRSMEKQHMEKITWLNSILIAMVSVYAYMVHSRGIVFLIATIICIVFIRFKLKNKGIKCIPFLGTVFILLIFDIQISKIIKSILYSKEELIGGSISWLNKEMILNLFSLKGMKVYLEEIFGWLFSSITGTYGLTGLGLIISFFLIIQVKRWEKYSEQELIIVLFSFLCFIGALVLGTLFFYNDIWQFRDMEMLKRGDKLIYGRYLDSANVCICFIAVYYLMIKLQALARMKIILSITLFHIARGIFISAIAEKINGTITYPHVLVTVDYLCNINDCERGGLYSTVGYLSGGIAVFGLLSFLIYIVVIINRKRSGVVFAIYFSVFLVGYIWNFFNTIYRPDAFMVNIMQNCETVIESVQKEQRLKNIYLDDELLRCSFQYAFSDYYIITARDDNRTEIENMFILSEEEQYNTELYSQDFYEIVNVEKIEEYHLYVKGEELNRALQENGYITKKIEI